MAAIGETSAQLALRDPDTRLMIGVRDDQPGAFEELVERYQHRLVAVLHHLVGNAEEAEDLAQEVFLRVYRARKKYRARCKFSTWLFTIANNLALNALRSRQRKPVVPLNTRDSGPLGPRPAEQLVQDSGHQPVQRIQQQELAAIIRQALDGLNERQRMAVLLNKFEDMNYAAIAEVMGLSSKAVKSLLCRARTNLRAALQGYIYMDGTPVPPPPVE
ncbi:MAG TPA: sigma-70 family RNA polymerase sigma factor [Gemmataceae bacterium]|nr:sigma-70 family RNA polymerase sigma factor [Gemmataceae bacterium]